MKKHLLFILGLAGAFALGYISNYFVFEENKPRIVETNLNPEKMKLGAFSMSLSVKDLKTSKDFYEKLGFAVFAGDFDKNYLIMKNENSLIGLFQGMFENNILTFNPGWDENAQEINEFDDIREIQSHLKKNDVSLSSEVDQNTKGPGSIMLTDPDGNMILIDQHR
ncbi:Glyoxalase/Bleomycin resistance protein/Dioxygenase superfamily [Belliella baltica DSM 15883]|uniref:Glyoxalase/Bleomycin resistance protein/Dioxygenase superfamily n=1 Tax=Belliella baltica (strain DSM 15883 / CIP 108006 / LMG 21964 / BA134) TaxID=866536 RepID=I3Z535_BELBD|nr:Glyoxalase/Bleomycin resistance protein/Dioxygenase superfamily [Belliella baltica DSM 15883]